MTFTKLIVAGSTGYLADAVLPALLNSAKPKFDITVLTRPNTGKSPSLPGAKLVPVDYDDHAALVRAIKGADAIVSLISGVASNTVDLKLFKAAQEAGVRRVFPSEYTLDVLHPNAISILAEGGDWPEEISSVFAARKFNELTEDGGPTSYTTVVTSAFIDSWIEGAFGLFDPKNRKVTLIDDGKHYFTGCSLPFLASAFIALLQVDEETTKNKRIHIAEVRTTMDEITRLYEQKLGAKFERTTLTSQSLLEQRNGHLQAGQFIPALYTGIQLGAFNGGGSADLKDGLQFTGGGFLDTKRKTLDEITVEALNKIGAL